MKFLLAPCHPSVVLGGAFLFFAAFESVPAMAVLPVLFPVYFYSNKTTGTGSYLCG
jgi:hypothetical protein